MLDQAKIDSLAQHICSTFPLESIEAAVERFWEPDWPGEYTNSERGGRKYKPHHERERKLQYSDTPRYVLCKGGEGGGKSVFGIIKTLSRLGRSMSGIMVSPDLPHFKRSLWPEFRRWCPWDQVVPEQQYRAKHSWEPRVPFQLAFRNGTVLYCGGIDEPGAWEGPNVSFAHFDEARRKISPSALKVLDGRVRIPGPNGEPSQIYITTTPRKHWLYEYFGPLQCKCDSCRHKYRADVGNKPTCPRCDSNNYTILDPRAKFKLNTAVVTLLTRDNEENLQDDFTEFRAMSLTAAEARVLLEAAWEDTDSGESFLPNMLMWDNCQEDLPPLDARTPTVVAMDAATGRNEAYSDCFGMVGVTRHPDPARRGDSIAVRFIKKWQARPGHKIDFWGTEHNPGPERVIRYLCANHNIAMVAYDPDQLHDMGMRLTRERVAWMYQFSQHNRRVRADTDLLNLIIHRRLAHDGDIDLREHIANADRKIDPLGRKLHMVKREESLKIDLAVTLSMAAYENLRLNI